MYLSPSQSCNEEEVVNKSHQWDTCLARELDVVDKGETFLLS